jgi:RND family efflux transporter MFP subunit
MKRLFQILLPLGILAVAGGITAYMILNQAEPPRRSFQAPPREVVVRPVEKTDYQIVLNSQGTVQARTTSTLIPEVRGRIVAIGPNFQEGAFFEEGEVLIEIDRSDYETDLIVAQASLAQAQLQLAEEQARSAQAMRDWERLNPGQEANALTLREPQLTQVEAAVASASARVRTAEVNLERTLIKAPFAGRMLSKSVDVGQYVSPGNQMARIYAVDYAEVRLPLTSTQFSFLDMPSVYRGENPTIAEGPRVALELEIAGETHSWQGRIIRAEGAVDSKSRQLFVVAQIRNPYGRTESGRPPLKVGSFVQAKIMGKVVPDVYVVPANLLRENSYVLMVAKREGGDVLRREKVNFVWQTDEVVVVTSGFEEGERLCLTQVPIALEDYPVRAILESEVPSPAEAAAPLVSRGPPTAGGGGPATQILAAIPADKPLPAPLKAKLDAAMAAAAGGDRGQMREVMAEVRAWAEKNGITLPPGGGR